MTQGSQFVHICLAMLLFFQLANIPDVMYQEYSGPLLGDDVHDEHDKNKTLTCPNCSKEFTTKQHLEIHEKVCNGSSSKREHLPDCPELTPPTKKSRLIGQKLIDYEVCT